MAARHVLRAWPRTFYDGPEFRIDGGVKLLDPFDLHVPTQTPLGPYTVGVTIYPGDPELSSDYFEFEMQSPGAAGEGASSDSAKPRLGRPHIAKRGTERSGLAPTSGIPGARGG